MIDLHLHTNMSDGSDSPQELFEKVIRVDCDVFSVTDHDDLRANNVILDLIEKQNLGLKFITGCEMSSVFEGRNLHLLCYGFDIKSHYIHDLIAQGAKRRRERVTALFDHLKNKHNIVLPSEDRAEILSRRIPGKVHVTDAVMRLGLVKMERQEFFDNYLNDMESREFKISAETVIDLVSNAGGVVSLAHPIEIEREYEIDIFELGKMVKSLKDSGLFAIEAFHSLHNQEKINQYEQIADKFNLAVSGGSDYHGKNKRVKIGQLSADGFVPLDSSLSILKQWSLL